MYLEIDEGFDSHPKTVRLCRVLGDVNAGQYLIRLWAWACRSAPDGDLSGMQAEDVEAIARYKPADGKLFAALCDRWSPKFGPWIDVDGDCQSVKLHGWQERQGAAIARMTKHAEYMRSKREQRKSERETHVTLTCESRELDVRTSPVQSSPVQSRQDKSRETQISICTETSEDGRSAPADASPTVLTFPCDGEPNTWALTQGQVDEWSALFPSIAIAAECAKALAWVKASPENRKTTRGMRKFLVGWFGRVQNRGHPHLPARQGDHRHGHARAEDSLFTQSGEVKL
jgi:hypothetical protein